MRMYAVLERRGKASKDPDRDVVFVKEGFAWPALLFGPLWALAHRMWLTAAVLAAAWVGVALLLDGSDSAQSLACLLLVLLQGFFGNDVREWAAARSGFELTNVVAAPNLAEAERRLFAAMGPLGFGW